MAIIAVMIIGVIAISAQIVSLMNREISKMTDFVALISSLFLMFIALGTTVYIHQRFDTSDMSQHMKCEASLENENQMICEVVKQW